MLPNTRRAGPRPGFTLVELLVVIAIMAVLLGLLMAGVQRARASAKRTEAIAQLQQLGQAIDQFKQNYPGARRLPCYGGYTNGAPDHFAGPFRLRSRYPAVAGAFPLDVPNSSPEAVFLKSMFPRMLLDPVVDRVALGYPASPIDVLQLPTGGVVGNGLPNLDLNPNQCLVFFLGGYFMQVDNSNAGLSVNRRQVWLQGNLTDPIMPFRHDTPTAGFGQTPNGLKGTRFAFTPERLDLDLALLDTPPYQLLDRSYMNIANPAAPLPDQARYAYAPQYRDPWGTPYMYVTTQAGNNDYSVPGLTPRPDIRFTPLQLPAFHGGGFPFPIYTRPDRGELRDVPMRIHRAASNTAPFAPFRISANRFVNEKTYQIISAGEDQEFGSGGLYRDALNPDHSAGGAGGDDLANFSDAVLGTPN